VSKKIFFEVEDAQIVDDKNNSQFATARILAFSSGDNRHDMICSEETLRKTAYTLYDKPIIYFASHSEPDKTLISGFVVPNSANFIRLSDNRLGLEVQAKIWKIYSPKVIELFQEKKNKKISVEMTLDEYKELAGGKVEMLSFNYYAVCVLGDFYKEASPGANMEMVSFASENKRIEDAYKKEFSKYGELDFVISEGIKLASKDGIELSREKGAKSTDLAIANYLIKNNISTSDRIRSLYSKFMKFSPDSLLDKSGKKWIAWQLLGGSSCFEWVQNLVEQMDEIEKISKEEFMAKEKFEDKPKEEFKEGEPQATMAVETPPKEEGASEEEMACKEGMAIETPEESAEEEKQEKEKAEKPEGEDKEEMSLDAYLDVGASLAMLQKETEGFKELQPEAVFTATQLFSMLFEKYQETFKENVALKEYKAEISKQQFDFAVNSTLKEIETTVDIPSGDIDELRELSVDFSIETIDGWKNAAYAKAFTFAKKGNTDEIKVPRYAINQLYPNSKASQGLWD
jgi:hypothetical protein